MFFNENSELDHRQVVYVNAQMKKNLSEDVAFEQTCKLFGRENNPKEIQDILRDWELNKEKNK